jgi:hypothetical protein
MNWEMYLHPGESAATMDKVTTYSVTSSSSTDVVLFMVHSELRLQSDTAFYKGAATFCHNTKAARPPVGRFVCDYV